MVKKKTVTVLLAMGLFLVIGANVEAKEWKCIKEQYVQETCSGYKTTSTVTITSPTNPNIPCNDYHIRYKDCEEIQQPTDIPPTDVPNDCVGCYFGNINVPPGGNDIQDCGDDWSSAGVNCNVNQRLVFACSENCDPNAYCTADPDPECYNEPAATNTPIPTETTVPTATTAQNLPTATLTPLPTLTVPPGCSLKTQGDANCVDNVNTEDFKFWQCEFIGNGSCSDTSLTTHILNGLAYTGKFASFNLDQKVDLVDFEVWRNSVFEKPAVSPTSGSQGFIGPAETITPSPSQSLLPTNSPTPIPTSTPIIVATLVPTQPGCKTISTACNTDGECCAGLQCFLSGSSRSCQPPRGVTLVPTQPSCKTSGMTCNMDRECCTGLACRVAGGGHYCQ